MRPSPSKQKTLDTYLKRCSTSQKSKPSPKSAENFSIACLPKAKLRSGIWEWPPKGYMKLNVDAGFDQDLLEGSVGAVIRDQSGQFIAAANERIDICFDSFTAEALAVRFGLNLARTVGCSRIVVSSDNLDIVEALKNGNSSSVASTIIDD
ncbi:hypothetical protein D1007_21758 [Hordeum vulgare]|nr:hypothetical protein D1007_21758 [Hordeum vulgare]